MEAVVTPLKVKIEHLLAAKHDHDLPKLLRDAAEECRYFSTLDVSFDYWHYGRHAEHAKQNDMPDLSALFAAAWQIQYRVFLHDEKRKDGRTMIRHEKKAILAEHAQRLERYRNPEVHDHGQRPLAALAAALNA